MKKSIFASSAKTVLALLVSASAFSMGCDAVSTPKESPEANSNSFTANIDDSGQKRQLKGAAAMGSRGWDGSGGIFTVSDDWCADSDDHNSDYTFFTIELMPGDDNPLSESIYFFYEGGVPQAGTYDIADYSFAFDSTAWSDDNFPDFTNKFVASYSRMPNDDTYEYSFGTGGSLTITEITDDNVVGTFNFVSDQCISFGDLGGGADSLDVDWEPNVIDKDLLIDGEFNISLYNDNGDGGTDGDSTNSNLADALKELAQQ